jgi:hypothetical protein
MKKLHLLLIVAIASITFAACGNNNTGSGASTTDSSANVTKPATNSDATNPSVADTAYSKNNADTTRKDSSSIKK